MTAWKSRGRAGLGRARGRPPVVARSSAPELSFALSFHPFACLQENPLSSTGVPIPVGPAPGVAEWERLVQFLLIIAGYHGL